MILPLARRRRFLGLVSTVFSSLAWTYGGWISTDRSTPSHARSLSAFILNELGDSFWKLNPFDELAADVDVSEWSPDTTQVLDVTEDFGALERRFSKGHRAAAKQAARHGVTTRLAASLDDWRAYYGCYEESLARWGSGTLHRHEWGLFGALAQRESEHVRLWVAEHDGAVVAGALCLSSPVHVAYWHGAARTEALPLRPVHLLLHRVIAAACASRARWFDLMPSGPLDGVRAFKEGFAPQTLACPQRRVESPWLRRARTLEARARRLCGR